MTESENVTRAYNVEYRNEFLEIDDFRTIIAEDEDTAREVFNDEYAEGDRHEIQNVELAYELDQDKVEQLIDGVQN